MDSDLRSNLRLNVVADTEAMVVRRVKAFIESGVEAADGRLPCERDLTKMIGVSRRKLRRALDVLEAEGLIWRKQGKGTFAGQPPDSTQVLAAELVGDTTIMQVMDARLCIEPALAAMCARTALPADIERLRNLAARTLSAPDVDSIELWDSAFHRLIARVAANPPLLTAFSMLDEIRSNQNWKALRSCARNEQTLMVSDQEHRAIIERIEAGDAAGAEAAMRQHLSTLADNLRRILPKPPYRQSERGMT
ncbi:FadR/GntR family transcriptional regulator [Yoonia sp.]|uniref:FadR/GntR family transcriptional regulator n=1 Tax=Yoonia sp. TaxID=2212373 RepID=UPI003A4E4B4D